MTVTCISLMTDTVDRRFMCLFATCVSSLVKCLLVFFFFLFSNWSFFNVESSFCIRDTSPFQTCDLQIVSPSL